MIKDGKGNVIIVEESFKSYWFSVPVRKWSQVLRNTTEIKV